MHKSPLCKICASNSMHAVSSFPYICTFAVLSVMWSSPKHFIVQTSPEGLFRFEGPGFTTVQELIMHQFHSGLAVTSRSGTILKTPIAREEWELNNDDVQLVEKIGRGNFGDVYKANLRSKLTLNTQSVAVKTCKVTLPEEHKKKFLQEGRILKQYDHPNIVKFIGICVQKQPIMIVMELVPGGSLLTYLRNSGPSLNPKCLLGKKFMFWLSRPYKWTGKPLGKF